MGEKHKLVGIVHEHRWNLDGSSWGGFSLYPINLREAIFSQNNYGAFSELVKAGDIIASGLPNPKVSKFNKLIHISRRIFNHQNQKIDLIKALSQYDSSKATILYHQMNSFAIPNNEILELSKNFNVRLISTLVDLQDQIFPMHFSINERKNRTESYEINFGHSVHIISISKFLISQINQYLDIDPSKVTPAPLGHEHFSTRKSESSIRRKVPFGSKYVLFPAKSWKHKGHLGYLKELKRTKPNLKTIFVGDVSSIEDELEVFRKDDYINDNCLFLNYVSDGEFKYLLENASAMVLPTEYEGFGLPYLEAAVSRIPVVTFETEAALEILGKEGASFAPLKDFQCLISNLLFTVGNNNEHMLDIAQAAAQKFSWMETARLTLEGYEKALLSMNEASNV